MMHRPLCRAFAVPVAAAALLLTACATGTPALPAPSIPVAAVPAAAPAPDRAEPAAALAASEPVELAVPAIGVRTGPLLGLGIDDHGALEVPPDASTAGWFTLGPTPGSAGPAVIAAHVDYAGVPGVFHRLRDLAPGDEIRVRRADGSTAVFAAYRVERYPKSAFPSEQVYGDTAGPELRLITCGGTLDASTGHYRDNVVAYARLVRVP
jgi:hypothetical protein